MPVILEDPVLSDKKLGLCEHHSRKSDFYILSTYLTKWTLIVVPAR